MKWNSSHSVEVFTDFLPVTDRINMIKVYKAERE